MQEAKEATKYTNMLTFSPMPSWILLRSLENNNCLFEFVNLDPLTNLTHSVILTAKSPVRWVSCQPTSCRSTARRKSDRMRWTCAAAARFRHVTKT